MSAIDSGHIVDILRLVMAGKNGLKRRVWSDDEKRTICAQALTPGVSVAQVARRYSMNANLIADFQMAEGSSVCADRGRTIDGGEFSP